MNILTKVEIPETPNIDKFDVKENTVCGHQCSGNCRREGCNCECGEWHFAGDEEGYCKTCNAILGDGHECDNCAFCGTEPI